MKDRQQKEVDAYLKDTAFFAFDNKRFTEGLAKLGITEADAPKKLSRLGNTGGYMLKEKVKDFKQMLDNFDQEQRNAWQDPDTGRRFAYDMFFYELNNHEYIITLDEGETLEALGITWDEVKKSPVLSQELNQATNQIMKDAMENGFI